MPALYRLVQFLVGTMARNQIEMSRTDGLYDFVMRGRAFHKGRFDEDRAFSWRDMVAMAMIPHTSITSEESDVHYGHDSSAINCNNRNDISREWRL